MASPHPHISSLLVWLDRFLPASLSIQTPERWRIVAGAAIGILFTAAASKWLAPMGAVTWLVAPIGASAVLVFALPSSPLAQPWAVVGGNTLSALVGTACALVFPDTVVAAGLAVSLAIGAMMYLRCLHPPGGAAALLVALGHNESWAFAAFPVFTNSLLLVCAGLVFNTLTGRAYPHKAAMQKESALPTHSNRFTRADLDTALEHYNQVMDVDPDDLVELLQYAEAAAYKRTLGELRCKDIMTTHPQVVEFGTGLSEAWTLMRKCKVKALPVVDRARRVVGIVTVADFLRHARMDEHQGLADRLQNMLRPSGLVHTDRPEVVGQIMTRKVRVASADRHAVELLPLFSEAGHHHLPIIDHENRLVGILTQSDLVRSLSKAVQP
ncbi:MAG: HPP family protein [Pseudomonadota bacterium]